MLLFLLTTPLMVVVVGVAMILKHPNLGYRIAYIGWIIELIAFGICLVSWE
jgi:hypothetical protein